jgi:hypothetical protein
MKRLNVFATTEEIAYIKDCANAPVMAFGDPMGGPPIPFSESGQEAAHKAALKHGLPEIQGYYGVDLKTGEFVSV